MLGLSVKREWTPLQRGSFWVALVALVANDHFLKGAEVLPAGLTGKLSDFAGLIVAPVLLATLFGFRNHRRRLFSFLAVAVVFCSINLFPSFARVVESATAAVGIPWTIWCDPTDLVALLVLPFSWWLLEREPQVSVSSPSVVSRVAVLAAALACMGTSQVPPAGFAVHSTSAYVLNDTGAALEVQVRWLAGEVNCSAAIDLSDALGRASFEDPVFFTLDPLQTLPLSRSGSARCDAAIVSAPGLEPRLAFWLESPRDIRASFDRSAETEGTGEPLVRVGEFRVFRGADAVSFDTTELDTFEVRDQALATSCAGEAPVDPGWSQLPPGNFDVLSVRDTIDGCASAEVRSVAETVDGEASPTRTFHYCTPNSVLTFEPGDVVRANPTTVHRIRDNRPVQSVMRTSWTGSRSAPGSIGTVHTPIDACGLRSECGGYGLEGFIRFGGGELFAGDSATTMAGAGGALRTVQVLRAEVVVVTHPDCAGFENMGPVFDILDITDHPTPGI